MRTFSIDKRFYFILAFVAAAVTASMLFAWSSTASAQTAGANFTVAAGFGDIAAEGLEIEEFLPEKITVREGDSITWTFDTFEPHTATFLSGAEGPADFVPLDDGRLAFNPAVGAPSGGPDYDGTGVYNSGMLTKDAATGAAASASLTFTTAGTYEYVCLIHPGMLGEVTVLAADADYPFTQADWDAAGAAEKAAHIAALAAERPPKDVELADLGDGTREYTLKAGISTANIDLMWFEAPDLTVYSGDTVKWTWDFTFAPHTVTFTPEGEATPAFIIPEPQEAGPPNLVINPVGVAPAGGATHSPTEFANSGMLFNPLVGPPGAPGTYSLKFEEPGSYRYICLLHELNGMVGRINVIASTGTPSVGDSSVAPWMLGLAALMGFSLVSGGTVWTWRKVTA